MNTLQQTEIERFLFTGDYDNHFEIWPGGTFVDQAKNGSTALRNALISTVQRAEQSAVTACQEYSCLEINAREKFAPMVRGLFPHKEQMIILGVLERSVVFLTPATINTVLEKATWLKTAWNLANIYLVSLDAKPLSDSAPDIVGISEETTCFVSMKYFSDNDPLEDYVIHEAAHIFHNCKREMIGLPATRRRKWLLDIDFAKRETFAYSCEAYSRILELGKTPLERFRLLSEHIEGPMPSEDRLDADEYVDILREAVSSRNGWKRILDRCSPTKHSRRI